MRVHPYLNFDGRCGEAFRFYAEVLGGTLDISTFGESPVADQMPEEMSGAVMHARLDLPGEGVLMGSDTRPDQYERAGGSHVSLQVDDPAEADRIFRALAEGGSVTMPIDRTFWAERFGMLVDRYGVPWMVNCDVA